MAPVRGTLGYILNRPSQMVGKGMMATREELEKRLEGGLTLEEILASYGIGARKGIETALPTKEAAEAPTAFEATRQLMEKSGLPKPVKTALTGAGLAAEFIIPAVPIGKIAKTIGVTGLAKKGIKAAGEISIPASRYGSKLGQLFGYRYGQPEDYKKLAEVAELERARGAERALGLAKPITKLSPEDQQEVAKFLKGEVAELQPRLMELAEPVHQEFIAAGAEAVKEGLLDAETYQKNFGKYLPRLYKKFEEPGVVKYLGFDKKPQRLDLSRFMKRKDIPEDMRKAMGEITEAGYPTAKGITQISESVAKAKLFRKVSETAEWASKAAQEGMVQLPEVKTLGKLSGKYVLPVIADDINEIIKTKQPLEKLGNKVTSWWKFGKTVTNPGMQARNIMSNAVLAHTIGELPPTRVDIYINALTDTAKQAGDYQEMKALGKVGKTFYGAELSGMLESVKGGKGIMGIIKGGAKKLGEFYQAQEEWFKVAVYKYQKEMGKTAEVAANIAEEALFDYSKVPTAIKDVRQSVLGIPFVTFPYKAAPALTKAFMERPKTFAQYSRMFKAIESLSPKEEIEREKEVLPDWMQEIGRQFTKLPVKDKYGRSQYLDLSYIMPWFSVTGVEIFKHPLLSIVNDLRKNSDYFNNKIYNETDTIEEKYGKITKYIWKQAAPSLPGIPGTYGTEKLTSAIAKKPDYKGRIRELPATILDVVLGLKTTPISETEERSWRMYEKQQKIEEIQALIQKAARNRAYSTEERSRAIRKLQEKLRKIQQGL